MMKITGLSHLFKWENLHNWWLTKYFFAPLYLYNNLLVKQYTIYNKQYTGFRLDNDVSEDLDLI